MGGRLSAAVRGSAIMLGVVAGLAAPSCAQELAQGPQSPIRLPAVTISAPARLPGAPLPESSVPATVQTITADEIRRSGAVTLQDYLGRLPGVTLNDEQGNTFQPGVQLRGFQVSPVTGVPQGVSVFVDGVRVNEPTVEEVNFDLIPLDDVERIELIRGPSAVFGRNALGGSLNIVTRRGSGTPEIVTSAEGGSSASFARTAGASAPRPSSTARSASSATAAATPICGCRSSTPTTGSSIQAPCLPMMSGSIERAPSPAASSGPPGSTSARSRAGTPLATRPRWS